MILSLRKNIIIPEYRKWPLRQLNSLQLLYFCLLPKDFMNFYLLYDFMFNWFKSYIIDKQAIKKRFVYRVTSSLITF